MWENAALRWEQLLLHPLEELEVRGCIRYRHLCQSCATDVKRRSLELRDRLVKQLVSFFKLEAEVGPVGGLTDELYDEPYDEPYEVPDAIPPDDLDVNY